MRLVMALLITALIAGCASNRPGDASVERVAQSVYVPDGPPKLTLVTMVNNTSGNGGHTALMVSGREQVIFDPAGSFQHPDMVERGDVLYGVSPAWFAAYKSAHAREAWHVVTQEIEVTPQQADIALQLVKSNGSVGAAFCTNSTSSLMRNIPGFEDIDITFYPVKLMGQIAQRPDVITEKYYENDEGDVLDGIVGAAL